MSAAASECSVAVAGNARMAPVTTADTGTPSSVAGIPRTPSLRVKSFTWAWPLSSHRGADHAWNRQKLVGMTGLCRHRQAELGCRGDRLIGSSGAGTGWCRTVAAAAGDRDSGNGKEREQSPANVRGQTGSHGASEDDWGQENNLWCRSADGHAEKRAEVNRQPVSP
jgi:hypothetical protein